MNPLSRWARMWHTVRHGRNPLARSSDRLEGTLIVVGLLLAMLAFPCAAAVGSVTYAHQQDKSTQELRSRTPARAVLLENGPSIALAGRGGVSTASAPTAATWTAVDGSVRIGDIPAARGTLKGRSVDIWLDHRGNPVDEPLTQGQAVARGVGAGIGLWLGVIALLAVGYLIFRLIVDRHRAQGWQREWWLTEERWTRS